MTTIHICLYRPEIPPNTGNIARLCVNAGIPLHIIDKPSFDLSEKAVRRAGLDYWPQLSLQIHENWSEFTTDCLAKGRAFLVTKFGTTRYTEPNYQPNDYFIFGNETSGVPQTVKNDFPDQSQIYIPMQENSRSLNLSNSVAIVAYEALRQLENW